MLEVMSPAYNTKDYKLHNTKYLYTKIIKYNNIRPFILDQKMIKFGIK